MNKKYLVGVGIVVILLLASFVIWKVSKKSPQHISHTPPKSLRAPLPKEATITLTKSGFSPNQVTIHVGTAVVWKNESGAEETVNSDNYPNNQLYRPLNLGIFNNNSTVTYTFKTAGVYGYHNQLQHTQEGKITVVN